ncbi:isopeptide-forming domain-containing fimbrial protein [Streptococcus suis]|nr:isopeptide-forming domain-containing fimbrial protein [Streptococcus suis]
MTSVSNIKAADFGSVTTNGVNTTVSQQGCTIKIQSKQEISWGLPRQPIDLVILQDASGSFTNTIPAVKEALINLTTPVALGDYDEKNPRLVFTNNPTTTDRVYVSSYQGIDTIRYYNSIGNNDFATYSQYYNMTSGRYSYNSSGLISNQAGIHSFINNINANGGTATVPAIQDTLAAYNAAKVSGGGMANNRKTVFLLITDGVANGYRRTGDPTIYLDSSLARQDIIRADGFTNLLEATQNYVERARELKVAGDTIKQSIGDTGTVVIGFWEDLPSFVATSQYGKYYLGTGLDKNDTRPVQTIFHEALRSIASPDKEVNGENVSFYVNEQSDINAFSTKILKAVTAAMTKENIVGNFTVTEGYKVNSVTINGKKVVTTVTNESTEIKGTVTQDGTTVKISVPDSVFNPGSNSFEYSLSRTAAEDAILSEDEETDPADDYRPGTKTETVGQLTGYFTVGDYRSALIGSAEPTTVQVTDLKYCYPSATKSITDADKSNDTGQLADPVVTGKQSYAANLSTFSEGFTYQVLYRMNNAPLSFESNPMLIDKLDYRLEYVNAYVTDKDGQRLDNFKIRTTTGNDALGNPRTIVVADIPEAPGIQTQYVNEGKYGAHKFKQYILHVSVRIKDQYSNAKNPVVYRQILQENDGLGILNQANIVWNGTTNNPEDESAKTRRSNTVYVKPPVVTDIKKDVQSVPNKDNGYKPNNSQEYLRDRTQEFYYNVESSWPGLFDTYNITDTLVPELEVISADVFINDIPSPILSSKLSIDSAKQSVALKLVKADVNARLNLEIRRATANYTKPAVVRIGIKARIRDNANLAKYVVNGEIKVPNKAQVVLNGKIQTSNTVYVTPKEPGISKKINDSKDQYNALQDNENFTFDIKTKLPSDISTYKSYRIVDVLDERLEIKSGAQPFINTELAKHFDVSYDPNTRTVTASIKTASFAQLTGGETVHLTIPANVKSGTAFAEIPNEARVYYTDPSGAGEKETPPTPPVIVTPPPTIEKQVNAKQHADLTKRGEVFEYTIKSTVPKGADTFEITDELDEALEFAGNKGDVVVKIDNVVVTNAIVATVGRNLSIKFTNEQLKNDAGKAILVTFKAKIRSDANLSADKYVQDGTTKVPNTAKYILNNNPKESNKVTVTPPSPENPPIVKDVNGAARADLGTRDEVFTYNITTSVPVDATAFEVSDTLVDVLTFEGDKGGASITIDGEDASSDATISVTDQTLKVSLSEAQVKSNGGKKVVVSFKAKIRPGANLSAYIVEGQTSIPNTAEYVINNNPSTKTKSNEVPVTPPSPENPPIVKDVNGAARADLGTRDEVFTYNITTSVPVDATAFEVSDTLVDVLTFEGDIVATLSGKAIVPSQISVEGQTVTVKLTQEQVRDQAGEPVHVEFSAKVKEGADLTPYITNGETSVPNTAAYMINNNPSTKTNSNTVPVHPPTPTEPELDKKINRDLTHLDVEVNKAYMYNVTADIPQDIDTYREFVITDTLESVLAINGDVVAYVDGYATDAVQVTVEGNRVVATVVDFARLVGFKQIQLYIPAYIKSDADLTAYMTNNVASIPNTASLDFTDSNGVKKRKDTTPVTVTPPTPETPPTPPVNPPKPGEPVKTVSRVEGLEQTDYLELLQATELFRFDIKSIVPIDEAEDKRLNLTSITITDNMDSLFTVTKDKVAVKITDTPTANANYIDEDVEKAQAEFDVEKAKLEEIKQSSQTEARTAALAEAQATVAMLETQLVEAQAKLAEVKVEKPTETSTTEQPAIDTATVDNSATVTEPVVPTEPSTTVITVDNSAEIIAQEAVVAELQAKLATAKEQLQEAKEALANAKTDSEVKVEVSNQEKIVAAKQKVLDEAKEKQAKVQERMEQLAKINDKGELTPEAIAALGGTITVEGQLVTVDFVDEYTMEALKGYTVNVIIYSSISDVSALTLDHFTKGIDNTATVQFNHDPSDNLTKKTNKVTVIPPKPKDETPPPPTTPEQPKGELPPPTTPPTSTTPPPSSGPILPKTGTDENGMYTFVGMILGGFALTFRKRKQ